MDPVKLRVYTERFEKEKKYIRLQEKFVAIGRNKPLTAKFYAKHDVIPESEVRQEYVDLITKRLISVPTDIYRFRPPAINMEYDTIRYDKDIVPIHVFRRSIRYGWFSKPLIPQTSDRRLRFPKTEADFIANEIKIRYSQRGLPVEKFTGVPFKV